MSSKLDLVMCRIFLLFKCSLVCRIFLDCEALKVGDNNILECKGSDECVGHSNVRADKEVVYHLTSSTSEKYMTTR